ncbi:MAG: helix-turn-helix transcriptional regulator [Deltaproteobacteria bacterium]|nr:helix-turn-helix transcriptional regulator [Deltaproteobacteria bacterium]
MKPHRPHPSTYLNLRQLKALRQARGLTQAQLSSLLGLKRDAYQIYESGKSHLPLCLFRRLCLALDLDPFTVLELLYLTTAPDQHIIPPQLLRDFRRACQLQNTTPTEALHDLISVFAHTVIEEATLTERI